MAGKKNAERIANPRVAARLSTKKKVADRVAGSRKLAKRLDA